MYLDNPLFLDVPFRKSQFEEQILSDQKKNAFSWKTSRPIFILKANWLVAQDGARELFWDCEL